MRVSEAGGQPGGRARVAAGLRAPACDIACGALQGLLVAARIRLHAVPADLACDSEERRECQWSLAGYNFTCSDVPRSHHT
eukprot:scaffold13341_cov101-Isochrysis_galbana.AAC.14